VISGTPRRSVASEIASVSTDANAPRIAQQLFSAIRRYATVAALAGAELESARAVGAVLARF
jgi:hypothetical protein